MDTLNFGIVFPLLPEIAKKFGADVSGEGIETPQLGNYCDLSMYEKVTKVSFTISRSQITVNDN